MTPLGRPRRRCSKLGIQAAVHREKTRRQITNNTKCELIISVSGASAACMLINDGWRYLSQVAGCFVASSFW